MPEVFYRANRDIIIVVKTITFESGKTLTLKQGDLTQEDADAIVNAANEGLCHGGGIAGAIVRKGGQVIQDESDRLGRVKTGEAVVTGAGKLRCKWVIHAVGPVWPGGRVPEENDLLLALCVTASLERAREKNLRSVALTAISSGIFGFPKDRCARVIFDSLEAWAEAHPDSGPSDLRVVILDDPTYAVFAEEWEHRVK